MTDEQYQETQNEKPINEKKPREITIVSQGDMTSQYELVHDGKGFSVGAHKFVEHSAYDAVGAERDRLRKALLELGEELHDERCGSIFTSHEYDENCPQVKGYLNK